MKYFPPGESPSPDDAGQGQSGSGRPVRAAVVTAAAISEAQNDILAKFDRFVFDAKYSNCLKILGKFF